jgi:hypothetical protein
MLARMGILRFPLTGSRLRLPALFVALAAAADASAASSPREVVAAKFAAVNRHALPEIILHYAPDAIVTASDFCAPRKGHADIERTYRGIFAALPDAAVDVQEYVVEGDNVAARIVVRGQFKGRTVSIPIMNFFTVSNGLIVRDDGLFDSGGRPCAP